MTSWGLKQTGLRGNISPLNVELYVDHVGERLVYGRSGSGVSSGDTSSHRKVESMTNRPIFH